MKKCGNFYNGFEALEFLRTAQVDLIFLDVNMPILSGFELLKSLAKSPKVIVTSAYQEFALQGYELEVSDYLLKPFSLERFVKAVNKIRSQDSAQSINLATSEQDRIFLKSDKKYIQIETNRILYVEALGNYCKVYHLDGMIICPDKISDLEMKLGKDHFLRVHKSYLVNTGRILSVEGNRLLIRDKEIPIGQTYKGEVNRLLI
jgi:DNA-binding LytR/AlgR family response regulator